MARLGCLFDPENAPEKVYVDLSQEIRHMNIFSAGPKWGVLGGGQKVYVDKVDVLFLSPILGPKGLKPSFGISKRLHLR